MASVYSPPMSHHASDQPIDLRSDTVTKPTDEMRRAMAAAEDLSEMWLRIRVTEPARAGLAAGLLQVAEMVGQAAAAGLRRGYPHVAAVGR